MEQSILKSTKKILGLEAEYTAFDLDILTHINSILMVLTQIGIGPAEGFEVEDDSATWGDFLGENAVRYSPIKTYVYLRVRILFDPPQTSYVIQALNEQIRELEWRLNINRESTDYVDPPTYNAPEEEVI